MEEKRRVQKNKIINEIKSIEVLLTRSSDTITRLRESDTSDDFEYVKNQIGKHKCLIEEKTLLLENLKDELISIETGLKDNEINKEYEEEKIKNDKIINDKINQKINKRKERESNKELSKIYKQNVIAESRDYRQYQKEMSYAHKYFNKVCEQLPDYMIKNLSEMPNNKGYIWRGVHFYGDLEIQPNEPMILFEKQKNILVIHEYNQTEYKRFEKNGKDRKILVHSEKLKPKPIDNNLLDYLKTPLPTPIQKNKNFSKKTL